MGQRCADGGNVFRKGAVAAALGFSLALWLSATSAAPPQQPADANLPFLVIDLQRRASAQLRAAESLISLLDGEKEGRVSREDLHDLALSRLKLIKDLSKDIEWDLNVRKLDLMRRGQREPDFSPPSPPQSKGEARLVVSQLSELTRQVKERVNQITEDTQSYEVHVEELAQPQVKTLCRRIRKLTDLLEDFFKR